MRSTLLPLIGLLASASSQSQPPSVPQTDTSALLIRQLDVGQGDAALIITPEGKRILIDAGHNADTVASILQNAGIDTIDLVVASHAHADHLGGMPAVLFTFVIRAYVDNGIPYTTAFTLGRSARSRMRGAYSTSRLHAARSRLVQQGSEYSRLRISTIRRTTTLLEC